MRPVRDQAESPRAGGGSGTQQNGRSAAAAAAASDKHEARLAQLRMQLGVIGTAAGLQDRQSLELAGQELLGGSPREGHHQAEPSGNGNADWWLQQQGPQQQGQQQQPEDQQPRRRRDQQQAAGGALGLAESDSFADLDAVQVQEQDLLPGSAATSRRGSFSFNHQGEGLRLEPASRNGLPHRGGGWGSSSAAAAAPAAAAETSFGSFLSATSRPSAELSHVAALHLLREPLRPPAATHQQQQQQQLPDDSQLLQRLAGAPPEQLEHQAAGQRISSPLAPAATQAPVLGRCQSAAFPGSLGGSGGAPPSSRKGPARSASTSRLQYKDMWLGEREPVDIAMRRKRQRLRRLATAPPAQPQP